MFELRFLPGACRRSDPQVAHRALWGFGLYFLKDFQSCRASRFKCEEGLCRDQAGKAGAPLCRPAAPRSPGIRVRGEAPALWLFHAGERLVIRCHTERGRTGRDVVRTPPAPGLHSRGALGLTTRAGPRPWGCLERIGGALHSRSRRILPAAGMSCFGGQRSLVLVS